MMKLLYPNTAASLCARMSRGFNGQDANGLLCVLATDKPTRQLGGGGRCLELYA